MQDSHLSLCSTKTLHHLYISDPPDSVQKMLNALFIEISLEYSENYMDKLF